MSDAEKSSIGRQGRSGRRALATAYVGGTLAYVVLPKSESEPHADVKEQDVSAALTRQFPGATRYTIERKDTTLDVCVRGDGGTDYFESEGGRPVRAWSVGKDGTVLETPVPQP